MTRSKIQSTGVPVPTLGYAFDDDAVPVESAKPVDDHHGEDEALQLDLREEGAATDAETLAMDNTATAVEMHTGLDREATIELGKDILLGEIPQDDVIWTGLQAKGISKDAAASSVQQVVQVGQSAAQREMGAADYSELSRLADSSPAIKNLVIDHGIKRMTGKGKGATWKQVLALARQFAGA
jgi:hypothetical protein